MYINRKFLVWTTKRTKVKEKWTEPQGTTIWMTANFLLETMEVRRKWHKDFALKEKSTQNFIPHENNLQESRWNNDILRKTKRSHCQHNFSKRITKGSFSDRGETITEGNLDHQEWRKSSRNGKYLDKKNRSISSQVL